MTLKFYLWGIRLWTLVFLIFFCWVLFYTEPDTGKTNQILFYLSSFLFLTGVFNLILLFFRRKKLGIDQAKKSWGLSLRQAVLLSLLTVSLLFLQSFRLLFWWVGLLVVAGIFLIELYFLSRN